jgi:TolB protein
MHQTIGLTRRRSLAFLARGVGFALAPNVALAAGVHGPIPNFELVRPLQLGIADFGGTSSQVGGRAAEMAQSLRAILGRSNSISVIDIDDVDDRATGLDAMPRFSLLRHYMDVLCVGSITDLPMDRLSVGFRLWDVIAGRQLIGQTYSARADKWERLVRAVAGGIYERLRGD